MISNSRKLSQNCIASVISYTSITDNLDRLSNHCKRSCRLKTLLTRSFRRIMTNTRHWSSHLKSGCRHYVPNQPKRLKARCRRDGMRCWLMSTLEVSSAERNTKKLCARLSLRWSHLSSRLSSVHWTWAGRNREMKSYTLWISSWKWGYVDIKRRVKQVLWTKVGKRTRYRVSRSSCIDWLPWSLAGMTRVGERHRCRAKANTKMRLQRRQSLRWQVVIAIET
jgi:hypothetical protein